MCVSFLSGMQIPCGSALTDLSGLLRSPDFDQDGYYDHNLDCNWTIVTEPGHVVLLLAQEEEFDIEASGWCEYSDQLVYTGSLKCIPQALWDIQCRFDNIKVKT